MSVATGCRGTIVSNDVRFDRLRALRSNCERLGLLNVAMTAQDGVAFPLDAGPFDAILLDVPCSCEGNVRQGATCSPSNIAISASIAQQNHRAAHAKHHSMAFNSRSESIIRRAQPGRWLALAVWFFFGTTLLSTVLSGSFNVSLWGEVPGQDGYAFYNILSYVLLFAVIATHLKTWEEVKRLELPVLNKDFLQKVGVETEDELHCLRCWSHCPNKGDAGAN